MDPSLADPILRPLALKAATERRAFMFGPLPLANNSASLLVGEPIFIPDVEANDTFGLPGTLDACGGACYNATDRTKLWWVIVMPLLRLLWERFGPQAA